MAGRGRGRGKSSMSFDKTALGFGRGENVPSATLQPPPLFPPLEFRPSPLSNTEVDNYLLVLKQELRGAIRESPYFLKPSVAKKDITRYSDRYKLNQNEEKEWSPDWNFFPKDLKPTKKRKAKTTKGVSPKITKRQVKITAPKEEELKEKIEKLEKAAPAEAEAEEDDEDKEEVEEYIDDDDEDDNDYNFDYYDDGGDAYGQGDDDGDDGPVY